jgi:predicted MFS family arabinose efflux permease
VAGDFAIGRGAAAGGEAAPTRSRKEPIWTWQLVLLLLTVSFGLATLNLALPVLPLTVTSVTRNTSSAGIVTAVVALLTMVFELQSARLLARFRPTLLLLAGLLVGTIAMVGFALVRTLPAMLVFGALAGAGFGVVATVSTSMVGRLAPPGRTGEGIGYYGLAASLPAVVAQPASLLLLNRFGISAVFWAGVATSLVAILAATQLRTPRDGAPALPSGGLLATLSMRPVLLIWASFVCVTFVYGGVISFTPLLLPGEGLGAAPSFLLLAAGARAVMRMVSGHLIDRLGDWRLVWPGLLVGALGLALLPFRQPVLTLLAALLYGVAFGVVQTGALVAMLRSTEPSRAAIVSGLWNMAVDAGLGAGALALAPLAAWLGYQAMFWTLPVLFLAALALRLGAGTGGRPSGHRVRKAT